MAVPKPLISFQKAAERILYLQNVPRFRHALRQRLRAIAFHSRARGVDNLSSNPQPPGFHPLHGVMYRSMRHFEDETILDNPIWNSLVTSDGPGADLAAAPPGGDVAALFLNDEPKLPVGRELAGRGRLVQMVCPAVPKQISGL